ncbi:MAG: hypothetical protein PHV34_05405 [Verrucomicrobiae bacterium]|nr:hypothetical protein [Verrucomicrobiae bacterium]
MENCFKQIEARISGMFDLAVGWSLEDGQMRDPYESVYSENFSPACWSAVAAGLYALTHEKKHLEWAGKWSRRSAVMMRESPPLRDYLLGYAAMIFPILQGRVDPSWLEAIRKKHAGTFAKGKPFCICDEMHIAMLQLIGNVYAPPQGEEGVLEARESLLRALEGRVNSMGFLADDRDDGHSIPHMLLTCASLAIFLLDEGLDASFRKRIVNVLAKTSMWHGRFNGANHLPAQANRSFNQMYVYPLSALLSFVGGGKGELERIGAIFKYQGRFTGKNGFPSITPNHLSPYATAGVETNYNRLDNDLGVGTLAWTLLLLLGKKGWPGIERETWRAVGSVHDNDAGFGVFHQDKNRVFFALRTHRKWSYHLPLQPLSICFSSQEQPPFCGAKRSGANNPNLKLIETPSLLNPLLDPYFGIYAKRKDGRYAVMDGRADALSGGGFKFSGKDMELSFDAGLENDSLLLSYDYQTGGYESAFFAVPVLLWDGKDELNYAIEKNRVRMDWQGRKYLLEARSSRETWALAMERSLATGYGVSGHMVIPIKTAGKIELLLSEVAG